MTLRLLTAGESHGPGLTLIIDGMPSGLPLTVEMLLPALRARQSGYGRGGRQQIEHDTPQILGGVRHGLTIGAPIAIAVPNRDFANWAEVMAREPQPTASDSREVIAPRPGHADLAGGLKHNLHDMRNILERASARETTMRVVAGSIAGILLKACGVVLRNHVVQIGEASASTNESAYHDSQHRWWTAVEQSSVRCGDAATTESMIAVIDAAFRAKDSIGGIFEVVAFDVPPGLGTYAQWDRRLDGRLAQAAMSIPGVKGVEFGLGFATAARPGSDVHDPIAYDRATKRFVRATNHAGGLEGGMSNGAPIVLRGLMKPLSTLMQPLVTVDVRTKTETHAHLERADTCVVPAAAVIAEAMTAWTLADALLEKTGGDSLQEVQRTLKNYRTQLDAY